MKIISKFWDYYDVGLEYGIDSNLVFHRKTFEVMEINKLTQKDSFLKNLLNLLPYSCTLEECNRYSGCLLYFCGEVYPYYKRISTDKAKCSLLTVDDFLKAELEESINKRWKYAPSEYKYKYDSTYYNKDYRAVIKEINIKTNSNIDLPYFCLQSNTSFTQYNKDLISLVAYPILHLIPGWSEERDAIQDFQTVSMEYARLTTPDSPLSTPLETDTEKVSRHGFDTKKSFRGKCK